MISASQQRTVYQHPCSMKLRTKMHTIVTCPTNNGVMSCPHWRLKTSGRGTLPKSKYLPSRSMWQMILISTQDLGWNARRRSLLACCHNESRIRIKPPIMDESSATVWYERIMGYLSVSICHIVLMPALEIGPNSNPLRRDWEETWETEILILISSTSPRRSVRSIWKPLINKRIWFSAWPSAPAPTGISRISLRYSPRCPRSMSLLSAADIAATPSPPLWLIVIEI